MIKKDIVDVSRADPSIQGLLFRLVNNRSQAIWITDLDDTLIDTVQTHELASNAIVSTIEMQYGKDIADAISRKLIEIFGVLIIFHQSHKNANIEMHDELRKRYESIQRRIHDCQQDMQQQWRMVKPFSREVLLKLASEDCGISLSTEQIALYSNSYWQYVESNTICFEDAIMLIREIAVTTRPLYIMTASDARMTLKENGQFDYNPDLSHRSKVRRLETLRATKGLHYHDLLIGDPIDKPSPEFFKILFDRIAYQLGSDFNPQNIIVLGDSYKSDLQIPITEWKVGLGILYRRGQKQIILEEERIISVGNWQVIYSP
jgi:hypothetical protein